MTRSHILGMLAVAMVLTGAACSTKTTIQTENTNVTIGTNTELTNSTVNTTTTGSFDTSNANVGVTTNTSVSLPTTATVTITTSGVSSKTITVAKGATVTFNNNDTVEHIIASNPHPSHTDLPGFELELSSGASKSFTFSKVGSWGYHDHDDPFNAGVQGTVVVK